MKRKNLEQSLAKLLQKRDTAWDRFYKQAINKIQKKKNEVSIPKSVLANWVTVNFKSYARMDSISLPQPNESSANLTNALKGRRSIRNFSCEKLSISTLSSILYYSAGIKNLKTKSWDQSRRFYPSAGARYPLEIYVVPLRVESLELGVYHYYVREHSLEQLFVIKNFKAENYFQTSWVQQAGCIILISAIFLRNTMEYGDRGYLMTMIEAGHLGQNLYLNSSAMDVGCCAVSGFSEAPLNKLIGLDGKNESVIYSFALGNKVR